MILVTFFTVSASIYLEKLLAARGIDCRIIPVPRDLSSSCGYAAELAPAHRAELQAVLSDFDVEWEAIYQSEPNGTFRLLANFD